MNAVTHAVFGVAALSGASLWLGGEPPVYAYPAAVVAAWVPDLDNPRSKLGTGLGRLESPVLNAATRPLSWVLRLVSFALFRTVGHRTLTHSLPGLSLFVLVAYVLLGGYPYLFVALVAGYASHILADGLNIRGVPLLWPVGGMFRFVPGGVRSGGVAEVCVALAGLALAGCLLYLLHPAVGDFLGGSLQPF